jgi:hypothetical protein
MKRDRILAIIGIVLPIIGFLTMMTTYDPYVGKFVPTFPSRGAEPYAEELQNKIWVKLWIYICVILLYQVFYYITSLLKGVKERIKILLILPAIGLLFCINLFIQLFSKDIVGIGGTLVFYIFYTIIFSIVMLVRSFKKTKKFDTV